MHIQLIYNTIIHMILKQTEGYPLYVKGDLKILERIKPVLTTTLSMPKSIPISVPFVPKSKQITPLLEPIIHLQTIDEGTRELVTKGKYHLKPETLYIYFPSQFRVDEKIYKSLFRSYQNMIDEVPRNIRPSVQRLIIWEEGKGEHSLEYQKQKINQAISQIAKQLIQTKLNSLSNEIKQYQSQPTTPKSLLHIFILKNKLACLYAHLQLNTFACDLLTDVWNQIMINFRCLMKIPPSNKPSQKLDFPQDIPRSPYTFSSTNDILGYFQSCTQSTPYLRIVTHTFLNFYLFNLSLKHYYEAISKLKLFLDYILNNVLVLVRRSQWNKQQAISFQIARNIWAIEVILKCLHQFQNCTKDGIDEQKVQNYSQLKRVYVSVCSMLRNSIERIGFVLYLFDNYSIFPGNILRQLKFINQKIKKIKQPWKAYKKSIQQIKDEQEQIQLHKSSSFSRRQKFSSQVPQQGPNQIKLRDLLSKKFTPPEDISKILISFQTYSQVYLKILQIMFSSLKSSPFIRVAKSLKLTMERATIMLGEWQDHQLHQIQTPQFKDIWPQLYSLQKLYKLYFIFVKVLSGKINKQILCRHLSEVVRDKQLQDENNTILKIGKNIHDMLQKQNIMCKVAKITELQINELFQISVTIKSDNISEIVQRGNKFYLQAEHIMLREGIERIQIQKLQWRQYKKCEKCPKQCSNMCLQPSCTYMQIKSKLKLANEKQKMLFYIKSIIIAIVVEQNESQLNLYLDIKEQLRNRIYKINTPKLLLVNGEQNSVYSQIWTPFSFHLSNFSQNVVLQNINIQIQSQLMSVSLQSKEYRNSRDKQATSNKQMKMQSMISVGTQFCIQSIGNQLAYYNVNDNINLQIDMSKQNNQLVITIFVKSQKPQKLVRNSKRKIQHHDTHEILILSATFRSLKLNKQYTLNCQTKSLIILPLLSVQYHIVQTNQEFMITNLRDIQLKIEENQHKDNQLIYQLEKDQSLCVLSRTITISSLAFSKMVFQLVLNEWFDSEHLLQQKNNTFRIWYRTNHKYTLMNPIQIESEIEGEINMPYLQQMEADQQGFEIVGKIHGQVHHIKDKCLNLWLIPISVGNIVLPEIWINGKRGIWVNSLITNIQLN